MNIIELTFSKDSGGADKQTESTVYENVPVTYEPRTHRRLEQGGKTLVSQEYLLTFRTHQDATRIDLDVTKQRFVVNARGNEPSKTFKIISLRDNQGVINEAIAVIEN